jgi:hypothetical protein
VRAARVERQAVGRGVGCVFGHEGALATRANERQRGRM